MCKVIKDKGETRMLRIKLVLAVVGAIVAVMVRGTSLSDAEEIKAYESWQGPPADE